MVAWLTLFEAAIAIIDEAERNMAMRIDWTIGGGTMLQREFQHRESKDIDIFVSDAQTLSAFSPRLNDVAARTTQGDSDLYVEQSNFIKIILGHGEIDFIVAPHLTSPYAILADIGGRSAMVETSAEILAKKIFYRAASFTARDVFDLAFLIEHGVAARLVSSDVRMYVPKLEVIVRRIDTTGNDFMASFDAIEATGYQADFTHCAAVIRAFVETCRPPA